MTTLTRETERVVVRALRPDDLPRVAAVDAKIIGRSRARYFELVLARNLTETGVRVSFAAEIDGLFVGFLLARAWYGEFGVLEPIAVLETLGVHPDFRRQGAGTALMRQLVRNLRALGLNKLRTEVDWREADMLAFFQGCGFELASRLVVERDLARSDPEGAAADPG